MNSITPISGESFNGLLHRWAAGNFIDNMMEITRGAGVEYPHVQDAALNGQRDLTKIARETGIPLDDLEFRALPTSDDSMTRKFFGVAIRKSDLNARDRRFAPHSLRNSSHHRAIWMVRPISFCAETWQYLRSTCHRQGCGVIQRWYSTFGVARCDRCLADLRESPSDYVPEEEREALGQAVNLLSPDAAVRSAALSTLPTCLRMIGPETAYELLIRLMKVVDPSLPPSRSFIHRASNRELSSAMAKAWGVLQSWPEGFVELASDRIRPRVTRDDGNGGETMRFLSLAKSSSLLLDPTAKQLVRNIRDSIDISEGANATKLLTLNSAARAVGLKQARLSDLRRRGIVRTRFAVRGDRPLANFCADEIASVKAGFDDKVSIETARAKLGITCHGIEQLLALGLVGELAHPYFRARYAWVPISRSSVLAFCREIEARGARVSGPKVPLKDAMKVIGGRRKPWGPIFKMLLEGELKYEVATGFSTLAPAIHIPVAEVVRLPSVHFDRTRGRPLVFSDLMSKRDAGETLNLGPVQATELLADLVTPTGSRTPAVPVDMVEQLARKYISTAELAWRLQVQNRRAYLMAKHAGVTHSYPGGFCRSEAEERLNLTY